MSFSVRNITWMARFRCEQTDAISSHQVSQTICRSCGICAACPATEKERFEMSFFKLSWMNRTKPWLFPFFWFFLFCLSLTLMKYEKVPSYTIVKLNSKKSINALKAYLTWLIAVITNRLGVNFININVRIFCTNIIFLRTCI